MRYLFIILLLPMLARTQTKTVMCVNSHYELGQYIEAVIDSSLEWGYNIDSVISYSWYHVPNDNTVFTTVCKLCPPEDSILPYFQINNDTIDPARGDVEFAFSKKCYEVIDTVFQKEFNTKAGRVNFQVWPEEYLTQDSIYKK